MRARIDRRKWNVADEQDYIARPKDTGYRAHHVVVLRDDRLIEIQLRTSGQHRWAEEVEALGSRTGFNLKDGQGPKDLLDYLERAAYATDLQERGQPVPSSNY